MGQLPDKCNCFNDKNGNKDIMLDDNAVNIQAAQHKIPNIKAIPSLSRTKTKMDKSKFKVKPGISYSDEYDQEVVDMIVKFQGIIRGVIFRNKLKEKKASLEKETLNKIQEYAKKFTTPILLKVENNPKFAYNSEGWKKFFPKDNKDLKVNFGKTFMTKLRISENGSAIYSGQTNLNGERHGYGVSINSNGIKYEGFWEKGDFCGWGKKVDQEGNVMIGKLNN